MKIDYIRKRIIPVGSLAQHPLNVVAELVQDLFTGTSNHDNELSYWQFIFMQSRANGCSYDVDELPQVNWQWPRDTWFQERLQQNFRNAEFTV